MPYHVPALLPQVIEALDIRPGGTYVDVTFGGGGHSRAILEQLDKDGRLFGFDQDIDASENIPDDSRFTFVHSNFKYLTNFLAYHEVDSVDGILADLGVSFHHFDDPERGFSFRWEDGALDMRMNRHAGVTAADYLRGADENELAKVFREYGELKNGGAIARAIVAAREKGKTPVTAADLNEIVKSLLNPAHEKKELACVYQALRIVVNNELEVLRRLLTASARVLKPGGRIAIITYHSLEDRLVKNFFKTGCLEGRMESDIFGQTNTPFKLLGNKPIVPDETEITQNPRSRSAKLRVAVRR